MAYKIVQVAVSYTNYKLSGDDGGDDGNSEHFRAIQP